MSVEETKIREALEMDVERDLEEEIKEGIYHLALKLHRLYQHQKQRINSNPSAVDHQKKSKLLSEVNINIKIEGGTTIQINEIKKLAKGHSSKITSMTMARPHVQDVRGKAATTRSIKFDWSKTLRSGSSSSPLNINKNKNEDNFMDMGKKIAEQELGWKY